MRPNLDDWVPKPALRVSHSRGARDVSPEQLWRAALAVRVRDAGLLGRLVRWRIPGVPAGITFEELFRSPPFIELERSEQGLVSGLVGRIWTLRRDYPTLSDPEQFREWSARGTARVLFANWVEAGDGSGATLRSESRVEVFGTQGRLGLAAVRPLVRTFQHLIASEGIAAAVRRAQGSFSDRR